MEPRSMEYFSAQVQQKDVGGRLQVGQELLLYLSTPGAIPDLEDDMGRLGKTVDALTGWVGSSNYRLTDSDLKPCRSRKEEVSLMGLEILSAFVDRLSTRFKSYVAMVIVALIDRMGDAKDKVRDETQTLILKLMDQVAPPMVRDAAILAIVEIYRHVGEKVRVDLCKRGIPPASRNCGIDYCIVSVIDDSGEETQP
ncbi:CLIP-associating protein 1 [Camelus dromedarius]|uniref:CLIP-associating protein 1 n=1 Tax=Camelus dromedarius TaxID=9838 RepID=A0A5N4D083_CAMDR|nr:CLIP-associating protein 1 [Camelus dromedarius]